MRYVFAVIGSLTVIALFWIVGEMSRANCIDSYAQATGCSILPWSEGNARGDSGGGFKWPDQP